MKYDDLASEEVEETSAQVKERVERARAIGRERFSDDGITCNAAMNDIQLKKYCRLSRECESALKSAYESLNLSARARSRIIKVARTIADIECCSEILPEHILEAVSYRSYDASK